MTTIMDPTDERVPVARQITPRVGAITGNVALLDISKPRGDVFIRGHVHHHHFCGEPHFLAMTLPALQGAASKFGGRICSLPVHFGLVWFDVEDDGSYSWNRDIIHVQSQRAKAIKL